MLHAASHDADKMSSLWKNHPFPWLELSSVAPRNHSCIHYSLSAYFFLSKWKMLPAKPQLWISTSLPDAFAIRQNSAQTDRSSQRRTPKAAKTVFYSACIETHVEGGKTAFGNYFPHNNHSITITGLALIHYAHQIPMLTVIWQGIHKFLASPPNNKIILVIIMTQNES